MLMLNHTYTFDEAIAAWGHNPDAILCDQQFVVFPDAILSFFQVSPPSGSHLDSPSQFVWKPARLDYDPVDKNPSFPTRVQLVRDPVTGEKIREHHLLVRADETAPFFYVGTAVPCIFSINERGVYYAITFELNQRLSRPIWLQLGGYNGWCIEVNHVTHYLDVHDYSRFETLLAEIPRQEFSHLSLTRYEQDSFHLFTNLRRGWLMYLREPSDSGLYIRPNMETVETEEVFECTCGISLQFPLAQTIERDLGIQAAHEFFTSGQLPSDIQWEEKL